MFKIEHRLFFNKLKIKQLHRKRISERSDRLSEMTECLTLIPAMKISDNQHLIQKSMFKIEHRPFFNKLKIKQLHRKRISERSDPGCLRGRSPFNQDKGFFFMCADGTHKKETSAFTGGRSTNHIINNTKTNNQ